MTPPTPHLNLTARSNDTSKSELTPKSSEICYKRSWQKKASDETRLLAFRTPARKRPLYFNQNFVTSELETTPPSQAILTSVAKRVRSTPEYKDPFVKFGTPKRLFNKPLTEEKGPFTTNVFNRCVITHITPTIPRVKGAEKGWFTKLIRFFNKDCCGNKKSLSLRQREDRYVLAKVEKIEAKVDHIEAELKLVNKNLMEHQKILDEQTKRIEDLHTAISKLLVICQKFDGIPAESKAPPPPPPPPPAATTLPRVLPTGIKRLERSTSLQAPRPSITVDDIKNVKLKKPRFQEPRRSSILKLQQQIDNIIN